MRPTLLLLPGFDGTGNLFGSLSAALNNEFDCVPVCYQDHADLAGYDAAVQATCPLDRPVLLLAESFSGPIGLRFLANAPDNLIGGIFSATFAKPPLALIISLAEKLRLASFTIPAVSEQILRWFCLNGVNDIALIREITAVVRDVSGPTVQSRLAALTQMDATSALADIDRPIMTIAAKNDRVIRPRYMHAIRQCTAHRRHATIDGPHLLLQARATAVAVTVREFTKSLTNEQ